MSDQGSAATAGGENEVQTSSKGKGKAVDLPPHEDMNVDEEDEESSEEEHEVRETVFEFYFGRADSLI
jgi:hypothetical protein